MVEHHQPARLHHRLLLYDDGGNSIFKKEKIYRGNGTLVLVEMGKGESHHIKSEVCILGVTYCSHPLELEASTTQLALSTVGSLSFLTYFSGLKVLAHHQIHMRDNTTMDQTQLNANSEIKYF